METTNRKLIKMYLNQGAKFLLQQAAELGSFSLVVVALELRIQERSCGFSLLGWRKTLRPGVCQGYSCMEVQRDHYKNCKSEAWIVGDAKVVQYPLRKAINRVRNQLKREKCYRQQNQKELEICRVLWNETWKYRIWSLPSCFWSHFGPVFLHYAPFPPFCNINVYSVPLYVGSIWSAFSFWF